MIGFQPYETFQRLAETGGIDRVDTLLKASCDAFSKRKKPDPNEIEQFEVLATRLFQIASPSIRKQAAAILKQSENLTRKLEMLIIENIDEEISDYLLTVTNISEQSLKILIERKDIDINATIAQRNDLTKPIITSLFQTNSRKTYRSLAANMCIKPEGPFLNALTRSAQMDIQVARSLARREDFDKALLAPVFFDLFEADRIKIIEAFSARKTPNAPIKKTIEQISVVNEELTQALMKLFSNNRRPEVANLLLQITGLDETRCAQIAHDVSGAALFVILRGFGCTAYDGLKVLIHATSIEGDRSKVLAAFARLFQDVSANSMMYMMSAWRNETNLLDLAKPEFVRFTTAKRDNNIAQTLTPKQDSAPKQDNVINQAIKALERIGARRAS